MNDTTADDKSIKLIEAQIQTKNDEIIELNKSITGLKAKIEAKHEAAETADRDLGKGEKSAITRWTNEIKAIKEEIVQAECTIKELLLQTKPTPSLNESIAPAPATSGPSTAQKLLMQDCSMQPMLTPSLDVSLFCQHMDMLHKTHVEKNGVDEAYFVIQVEQKLYTGYRKEFQNASESTTINTWALMRQHLLKTHKSPTTVFQEFEALHAVDQNPGESLRDFAARLKRKGDEAKTLIKAKFKDERNKDLTCDDLFELQLCNQLVNVMKANPKWRDAFNRIVTTLDSKLTIMDLTDKVNTVLERVHIVEQPVPAAYVAQTQRPDVTNIQSIVQSAVQSFMDKTKNNVMPDQKSAKNKKKKSNWKERIESDPAWAEKCAKETCHLFEKDGKCDRKLCVYSPCSPLLKKAGKSAYVAINAHQPNSSNL